MQAFLFGAIAEGKVDPMAFSLRLTGAFTPKSSGMHQGGVFASGPIRLLVDGKLVASAWDNWAPGSTFFEEGCDQVTGEVALEAGRAHEVVVEFASKASANLVFSALQAGIGKPIGEEEIAEAAALAKQCETVILCVGRNGEWDTEGTDLPHITLPGMQDALISAVAKANPNTIVVLQTGGPVEMPWLDEVAAVLQAWYPGQEAGNAIADVLFGKAEPGGRLAQTFPAKWADNPAHSQDPEVYPGHNGKVRYEEGLFTGHRHYDKTGIQPLFPFGFGLSYTTFAWSALRVSTDGETVTAEVDVTNTGPRAGSEVVQLYVEDPSPILPRPRRELKAFEKLHLAPGETKTAKMTLGPRAFACFDTAARGWVARAGEFVLQAGASAADIKSSAPVTRAAEWREAARK